MALGRERGIGVSGERASVATEGWSYRGGRLACGGVDAAALAGAVGTPCYVYDGDGIAQRYRSIRSAMEAQFGPDGVSVKYAVKACGNLAVLRLLAGLGCGMDVVTAGELERAWAAGTPMERVCFAGVSKGDDELRAALDGSRSALAGDASRIGGRDPSGRGPVAAVNVESMSELERLDAVGRELGVVADCTVRLNPAVTAGANEKVRVGSEGSKFGLTGQEVLELAAAAAGMPGVRFRGVHMHLGSQIAELDRFDAALSAYAGVVDRLRAAGRRCDVLNVGAGVAVSYMGEGVPSDAEWARTLAGRLGRFVAEGAVVTVEPGREIVGAAGVLLTRVRHVKRTAGREIIATDAGLNALVRPAMYGAEHFVWPAAAGESAGLSVIAPPGEGEGIPGATARDVVGPVCESSDVFARGRPLPAVERGDVLAVFTAGAYGMSMAMTFNDLPLPAEVLVEAGAARVVREHQPLAELLGPSAVPGRRVDVEGGSA